MKVSFYDTAEDGLFKYAVIIARSGGNWVFCKHRDRDSLEIPGGHREPGENIEVAARRELYEETGAIDYTLRPLCAYSVEDGEETFGMLYCAEIRSFEKELHSEIERIVITKKLPGVWTYPHIQPLMIEEYLRRNSELTDA